MVGGFSSWGMDGWWGHEEERILSQSVLGWNGTERELGLVRSSAQAC